LAARVSIYQKAGKVLFFVPGLTQNTHPLPVHPERDCEERAGAVEGWEGKGVEKAKLALFA
jgi:hypothetical protein